MNMMFWYFVKYVFLGLSLTRAQAQHCHRIKLNILTKTHIKECKVSAYPWFAEKYNANIWSGDWDVTQQLWFLFTLILQMLQ